MPRYEIRGALSSDEEAFVELARYLNTVNLPNSREHIRRLLRESEESFAGKIPDPSRRKYVFVLEDLETQTAVGTSTIVAQLGRRDAPYVFLDVIGEEKYSRTLDRHFNHTLLRLGFSYHGPTELGGLVVRPEYRRAPERLGLLISYVRFLFIGAHRELFQDELLAELLPPLEADGTSHLWEALGRHFTGLTYAEADLLSSENKDFVRDLFPSEPIYASLLSAGAQAVIGKVGAQTRGVENMLRRVGFEYRERIDPFDGGPHFTAPTDEVLLVRALSQMTVTGISGASSAVPQATPDALPQAAPLRPRRGLVAKEQPGPPFFKAVVADVTAGDSLELSEPVARHLGLRVGDLSWVLPLV